MDELVGTIPPSMAGLVGNPSKVGTLGGFINWKYGPFFALGAGLWSILALSGTLAGEARRGSLDFVAAAPFGKRRIALEKLAAHLTVMGSRWSFLAVATTWRLDVFGDASLGDEIPPRPPSASRCGSGFIGLVFGGLAFALAPLIGRAGCGRHRRRSSWSACGSSTATAPSSGARSRSPSLVVPLDGRPRRRSPASTTGPRSRSSASWPSSSSRSASSSSPAATSG